VASDADSVGLASANLLTGTANAHLRRERFADEIASQLLAGVTVLLEQGRQAFQMLNGRITVANVNSLGTQDLAENILSQRSAQDQPGIRTMDDPAWRQPPAPPIQSGIKAA
jgi:hypothetical protein